MSADDRTEDFIEIKIQIKKVIYLLLSLRPKRYNEEILSAKINPRENLSILTANLNSANIIPAN